MTDSLDDSNIRRLNWLNWQIGNIVSCNWNYKIHPIHPCRLCWYSHTTYLVLGHSIRTIMAFDPHLTGGKRPPHTYMLEIIIQDVNYLICLWSKPRAVPRTDLVGEDCWTWLVRCTYCRMRTNESRRISSTFSKMLLGPNGRSCNNTKCQCSHFPFTDKHIRSAHTNKSNYGHSWLMATANPSERLPLFLVKLSQGILYTDK